MKAKTKKFKAKKDGEGNNLVVTIPKEVIGTIDLTMGKDAEWGLKNLTLGEESCSFEVTGVDDRNNVSNRSSFTYDELQAKGVDVAVVMGALIVEINKMLPEVDYLKDKIK